MTPQRRRALLRFVLIAAVALALAHLLDRWFYDHFVDRSPWKPIRRLPDWRMMFRIAGYLPFWWLVSLGVLLAAEKSRTRRRGLAYLSLTPVAGALVSEIVKFLLRRERPIDHGGEYFFRPFDGILTTSGLAFPSSHALVAFSAAAALTRLYRKGWPLWWLIAIGCGLSRVAMRHHFLSDITLGAILGYLVAAVLARWILDIKPQAARPTS